MTRASEFANHSITGKVLADACWAALVAFLFGLSLGGTLIRQDFLYFTGMGLSGVFLIFALFWIRRTARRLATSESAKKCARQFLASCIYFSMLSSTFGIAASGVIWYAADFIRTFGAVWFGLLTCVAIFPVRRDAKRLNDARPSQITPSG